MALVLGPAKSSGFGLQPISVVDIKAYCELFKEELRIWEVEQLLHLAKEFVTAHAEFDGVDCAPPSTVVDEITDEHVAEVSNKLKALLIKRSQANKRSAPIGGRSE